MDRQVLLTCLDDMLTPGDFKDYCPNGLQVEGADEIILVVSAVSASQAAIDFAVSQGAQALLVHHGLFWRGDTAVVTGMLKRRMATLLADYINLFAYHLPLDCHAELGNNILMAKSLGWSVAGSMELHGVNSLGLMADFAEPITVARVGQGLEQVMGQRAVVFSGGEHAISRIGWCSGAAQDGIVRAAELGLDAYISGEVSERTVYQARELGIHYFASGHHASERFGVNALGEYLAANHGLSHVFFDDDNTI
jgi:dinuclear metal center YbgI/SA1388 family protein